MEIFNINYCLSLIEKEELINVDELENHINVMLDNLIKECQKDKFHKIIYQITNQKKSYIIIKSNIEIIKHEFEIIVWLLDNISYLNNIDNKDKASLIIKIIYYLTLIDYNRFEYKNNNMIEGRSVVTTFYLENIDKYIDIISELLVKFEFNDIRKRS